MNIIIKKFSFAVSVFFTMSAPLYAQGIPHPFPKPNSAEQISVPQTVPLHRHPIVLHIVTRVIEKDKTQVWFNECDKITISGKPVGMKIVGDNVIVVVQFTAYPNDKGNGILVAQGQIWLNTQDKGMQYKTTMQSVPLDFGQQVFFFPLGIGEQEDAQIQIQVDVSRYNETTENQNR